MVAIQTLLRKSEVPAGTSIIMLTQTLSRAIFVSVGQSMLQNKLVKNLKAAFPNDGIDLSKLASVGATQVRSLVPPDDLHTVLVAYNSALTKVYTVSLCMSALTIIGSVLIEWKSVKKVKEVKEGQS
jgi:hypothetical protein